GPLSMPDESARTADEVGAFEATQLFVAQARAARPGYTLKDSEAPFVAQIVRALDGLPLAIELAAARMGVLGAGQIVARLGNRFELLASRRLDASARHATLRSAIDWSWELLSPTEQRALMQCSVFRGGFSMEAAEAVVSLPAGAEPDSVLDAMSLLRDRSL